jgi:hypothetical protein
VIEFNLATLSIQRIFDLTGIVEKAPSNKGLEGLTFIADASNPEGGIFYAGLQYEARIYGVQLSINTGGTTVQYL